MVCVESFLCQYSSKTLARKNTLHCPPTCLLAAPLPGEQDLLPSSLKLKLGPSGIIAARTHGLMHGLMQPVPSPALFCSSFFPSHPPPPSFFSLYFQSILQNKRNEEGRSEGLWFAPQSLDFAGDLFFSFKTCVWIVGLLGLLFSLRRTHSQAPDGFLGTVAKSAITMRQRALLRAALGTAHSFPTGLMMLIPYSTDGASGETWSVSFFYCCQKYQRGQRHPQVLTEAKELGVSRGESTSFGFRSVYRSSEN